MWGTVCCWERKKKSRWATDVVLGDGEQLLPLQILGMWSVHFNSSDELLLTHFVQFQNPSLAFHSIETMAGVSWKPLEGFRFLSVLSPPQHNLRLPRVPNFFNVLCEEDLQVHWDSVSLSGTFPPFPANADVCGKEPPKEYFLNSWAANRSVNKIY